MGEYRNDGEVAILTVLPLRGTKKRRLLSLSYLRNVFARNHPDQCQQSKANTHPICLLSTRTYSVLESAVFLFLT